jgi:hypothetical protein
VTHCFGVFSTSSEPQRGQRFLLIRESLNLGNNLKVKTPSNEKKDLETHKCFKSNNHLVLSPSYDHADRQTNTHTKN